jgi:hypothetical protein
VDKTERIVEASSFPKEDYRFFQSQLTSYSSKGLVGCNSELFLPAIFWDVSRCFGMF